MAEDPQLSFSKKNSPIKNCDSSTGSDELFKDDLEGQGPEPDKYIKNSYVNLLNDEEEKESKEYDECSTCSCKTLEKDDIPESVRELLHLLVKRASRNQHDDGVLNQEVLQTSVETNDVHRTDESWTSSMATPSRNNSAFRNTNDSTLINFKFETSDLEGVSEDKSTGTNVNVITTDHQSGDNVHEECNSGSNEFPLEPLENLMLLSNAASTQEKLIRPVENISVIEAPGNSFFEGVMNSSAIDETGENEPNFLMSTPVKEYSTVNVKFNPIKYSFNATFLSSEATNVFSKMESNSAVFENLDDPVFTMDTDKNHVVPLDQLHLHDMSLEKELAGVTAEKQNNHLVKINDPVFEKVDTPAKSNDSDLNNFTQDILFEVNERNSLCATDLKATVIICGKGSDVKRVASLNEETICNTDQMATVIIDDIGTAIPIADENGSKIKCVVSFNEEAFGNTDQIATVIIDDNDTAIEGVKSCHDQNIYSTDQMDTLIIDGNGAAMPIVDENDSEIKCISLCNEEIIGNTDQMATVIDGNGTAIEDVKSYDQNICSTDQMATVIIGCNDCEHKCTSSSNEETFCNTDLIATVIIDSNESKIKCTSSCNEESICDTGQMATVILDSDGSGIEGMKPCNEENICNASKMETVFDDQNDISVGCVLSCIESAINSTDQMETVIIDENDRTVTRMSALNDRTICNTDKMQSDAINGNNSTIINLSSCNEHEEAAVDDKFIDSDARNLCVEVSNRSEDTREEPEYVTQVLDILCSPVSISGPRRQNSAKGIKRKSIDSNEVDSAVESKKVHYDNEAEDFKGLEITIADDTRSVGVEEKTLVFVGSSQEKMDEMKSGLLESHLLFDDCEVSTNKKASIASRCSKSEHFDKEPGDNDKSHISSQSVKTEIVDKFPSNNPRDEKAVGEELLNYDLNNSIVDNFFSETVIFDCDNISNQYQVVSTHNSSKANGSDVLPKVDASQVFNSQDEKENKVTDHTNPSVCHDVVIKTEPEDDGQSHLNFYSSQDYLSCSVLEEVCQATEALAYCAKGKNECMLDDGNEIEFVKVEFEEDVESHTEKLAETKRGKDKGQGKNVNSKITSEISCNNYSINPSSSFDSYACQSDRPPFKIESDKKGRYIPEEEDSKQNLKKRILFTAPECITLDDDIESWEVEFQAETEMKETKLDKTSCDTTDVSVPVQAKPNPQLIAEGEPPPSKGERTLAVKTQKFVYPKRGKKLCSLIPERVNLEDLMAGAVALEKCSSVLQTGKEMDIRQLKSGSLVCFNNLEVNSGKMISQQNDDVTSWNSKSQHVDDKILIDSKSSVTNQLSDNSEEVNYLLSAVAEEIKSESVGTESASIHFAKCAPTDCQETSLGEVLSEKRLHVDIKMLNEALETVQKKIETSGEGERCVSPILSKRIKGKRSFRMHGKNSCRKLDPEAGHSKSSREKLSDEEKCLKREIVIFPIDDTDVRVGNNFEFSTEIGNKESSCQSCFSQTKPLPLKELVPEKEGDSITVPTNSNKKVEGLDIPFPDKKDTFLEKSTPARTDSFGFLTASGKKVSVSEKAMRQAEKLFTEEIIPVINYEFITTVENEMFPLGKTCNKANAILTEDTSTPLRTDLVSFPTTSGNIDIVPEKSIQLAKKQFLEESTPARGDPTGFATASGNKVSVSEKALMQAKKLFSEEPISFVKGESTVADIREITLANENTSIQTKKMFVKDSSTPASGIGSFGFSTASGKKVSVSEKSILQAKKLFLEESTPTRADPTGFSTASGKKVSVSEKALIQAKKLFSEEGIHVKDKDSIEFLVESENRLLLTERTSKQTKAISVEDSSTPGGMGSSGFSTAIGKKVVVSEESILQAKKLFLEENTPVRSDTVGFSTASGKRVSVSEKALIQAKKLFSEEIVPSLEGVPVECLVDTLKKDSLPENSNKIAKKLSFEETSTPGRGADSIGFSTASGKKVAISEKSVLQAKKLFMEDTPSRAGPGGFLSASRKVSASEKALLQAMKSLAEETAIVTDKDSIELSVESEKRLLLIEKTLKPSKKIPLEDSSTPTGATGSFGFSTASGKKVSVSEKSILQAKKLFLEEDTPVISDPVGFSTASGKKVSVSEKALMQAKKLFTEETIPVTDKDSIEFSEESENRLLPREKTSKQTKKIPVEDSSTPRGTGSFGFSTASGKKVVFSEKSILQAKKLFLEDGKDSTTPARGIDSFGFSTASGKKVSVSEKSILQAKKLFLEESTPTRADSTGFSTASGKKVSVSEKALMQAKKLFSEEAIHVTDKDSFEFSIESENRLLLTEKTSKQAKKIPVEDSSTPTGATGSSGFSTASGKKVVVSEKSILQAKKLFLEESTPVRSDTVGFSTASGKKVSVSEKSLLQSKKLFSEEFAPAVREESTENLTGRVMRESIYEKNLAETKKTSHEAYSTPTRDADSLGFATASGKKVAVSEKSLLQARKLFLEESAPVALDDISDTQPIPATKDVDEMKCSEIIKSKGTVTMPACSGTPLPVKSVVRRNQPNLFHNSSVVQKITSGFSTPKGNTSSSVLYNVNKSIQDRASRPSLKDENLKGIIGTKIISSVSKNRSIEKQSLNVTQDLLSAESQGDNYIKAVDLALLNSPDFLCVVQGPPSPVFKTSNRKRKQFRNSFSSGKKGTAKQNLKNSCVEKPATSTSGNFADDTSSVTSTQSSCPLIPKSEATVKEKEMELWGTDLAEESWLGKQLDLAEASNVLDKIGGELDLWAAARKRQGDLISSKKNVRPVIGKHLQERKGRPKLLKRSSLREFMKGKRPARYNKNQLRKFSVRESTLNVTARNAAEFQFQLKDHYGEVINPDGIPVEDGIELIPNPKGLFGAAEAQAALLAAPGVDPSLLPPGGWCQNHYRWIVWKLASSERSFPEELGGRYLTPENVMRQLKYRWDREVDHGERPAIRKIFEMDDTASKRMILCVSSIEKPPSIPSSKKLELDLIASSTKLEFTDGWYAVRGVIDSEMAVLVQNGKLSVGTKIVTSGAELINCPSNGCHPLEPPASKAALRLNTNSTRRARWDAKLGYVCKNPGPLPVTLRSLLPGGGTVSALRNIILARTYPILNVEKTPDGRKVVRSQKAEARAAANYERQRQIWLENVYSQVSAEIQKEEEDDAKSRRQGKRTRSCQMAGNRSSKHPRRSLISDGRRWEPEKLPLTDTTSPEELLRLIEESEDASSLQSMLTSSQLSMLTTYKQEARERKQRELEDRVRQRIKQEEEKLSTPDKSQSPTIANKEHSVGKIKRDVVVLFKARLVDADRPVSSKSAVLTIWRPSEEVISLFAREGVILTIYGVSTNGMRSGFLQLGSTRQTRYKLNQHPSHSATRSMDRFPSLQRIILWRGFDDYNSQQGSGIGSPSAQSPPFGEIDLVAIVIRVGDEPNKGKGQGFQNVFVAGSDRSLMSIAFWGGMQEVAVDDILLPGVIIVATNLQWRRHHGLCRLPTVHAVETSNFTQHPGEERLQIALKNFQNELETETQLEENGSEFIQSCEQKLAVMVGFDNKEENRHKSGLSMRMPSEKLAPITPSVAARMKKLQMYEGAVEISLPACHLRKSAAVMKAFQPPVRCASPKSSDSEIKANKELFSDNDSPPLSLDSDP